MMKKVLIGLGAFVFLILLVSTCTGGKPASQEKQDAARARFDEILVSMSELDSITCQDDDCTSVVYFNFNQEPAEGLEFIVRANAVTFSTWKSKNVGGSYVTIFANLNGEQVLQCDANSGAVDSCF